MFKFLKKLFSKEEEIVVLKEEVRVDGLQGWLDLKVSQIDIQQEIGEFFRGMKEKKSVLAEKIPLLEDADIEKKHRVEDRIKNIVVGHRNRYAQEAKRFFENLEVPEEVTLKNAMGFSASLKQDLDGLAKRTVKSNEAARHLFFNQMEAVFNTLKEIALLGKDFDLVVQKKGLDKVESIREKIILMQEERNIKQKIMQELQSKEEQFKKYQQEKEQTVQEIAQLEKSEEYKKLGDLKKEEISLNQLIDENRNQVHHYFSQIARALRKYGKITLQDKLVRGYIEDTVHAFFNDNDLKILEVLTGLKSAIEKGDVEIKQKEKVLKILSEKMVLEDFSEKEKKLQKQLKELQENSSKYDVEKVIEETKSKLKRIEENSSIAHKDIEKIKSKSELEKSKKIEKELKELVKEAFKIELILT